MRLAELVELLLLLWSYFRILKEDAVPQDKRGGRRFSTKINALESDGAQRKVCAALLKKEWPFSCVCTRLREKIQCIGDIWGGQRCYFV